MNTNPPSRKELKQVLYNIRSNPHNKELLQKHKNHFTGSDIKGFDFSKLNLNEFNFDNVTAGITSRTSIFLTIFSSIIILVFVLIMEFAAQRTARQFIVDVSTDKADETVVNRIFGIYTFFMFLVPIGASRFKSGLIRSIVFTGYAGMGGVALTLLCCFFLFIGYMMTGNLSTENDWNAFSAVFTSLFGKNIIGGITGVTMILSSTIIAVLFSMVKIAIKNKRCHSIVIRTSYLFTVLFGFILFKGYHNISIYITTASGLAAIWCAEQITKQSLIDNEKYKEIKNISIAILTFFGTKFKDSVLDNASFLSADLRSTDFSQSNLDYEHLLHVYWRDSKGLDYALLRNTILEDTKVRKLLISPNDNKEKDFKNCNFSGANLSGADLRDANLTAANLSNTLLSDATLCDSNLTRVIALGTDFSRADLNAVCIDSLNVDNKTRFTDVKGKFIYSMDGKKDRYPVSGIMLRDDLENYLKKKLGTVDFIFSNGVNTPSFVSALEQYIDDNSIRIVDQNKSDIEIYGIENQGENIVIKVAAPDDENKEDFYASIMSNYHEICLKLEQVHGTFIDFSIKDISDVERIKKDVNKIILEMYPKKLDVIINYNITNNQNFFGKVSTVIGNLFGGNLNSKEPDQSFFGVIGHKCDAAINSSSPKERATAIEFLRNVHSTYSMVHRALESSKNESIQ
jgi:uncharacterized protein YjbI with pentapeptide repeats